MQVTIYLHNRLYQLEDKLLHHCHLRSSIQHLLGKQFNCLDNTARIAIFFYLRIWMSHNTEIWLADSKIQLNCQENWLLARCSFAVGVIRWRWDYLKTYLCLIPNHTVLTKQKKPTNVVFLWAPNKWRQTMILII